MHGRRLQGRPVRGSGHHAGQGNRAVLIAGAEARVMRNADGAGTSVVNHYGPLAAPLDLTCAAVVDLDGANLRPFNH
ncbi:tyrosinase cofactor [Streptomyces sp. NBC_00435]